MVSNYIICATPRSGSNLLCEVLASLGFAGRPFEHFWAPDGSEDELLVTLWPRVLEAGRGANGVFGLKLMYNQARRLEAELPATVGMEGAPLSTLLDTALNHPKYIYLTRRDHLRQAISLNRAIQSSQWRSMDTIAHAPEYEHEAITRELRFLKRDEADWDAFIFRHSLSPYRITYEELTADLQETVRCIVQFLGEETATVALPPAFRHHRQADSLTDEWLARYLAEESASDSPPA